MDGTLKQSGREDSMPATRDMIPSRLDELTAARNELTVFINQLEERLTPVLSRFETPQFATVGFETEPEASSYSPLTDRLEDEGRGLRGLIKRVAALSDRVEL